MKDPVHIVEDPAHIVEVPAYTKVTFRSSQPELKKITNMYFSNSWFSEVLFKDN